MKKTIFAATIIALSLVAFLSTFTPAFAADKILDTKVKQVVTKNDKNGNEYTRLTISETKDLNGVKYSTDTAVMCFGDTVVKAKTLKSGDSLKAVVTENEYKGRISYNLIAFVAPDTKK